MPTRTDFGIWIRGWERAACIASREESKASVCEMVFWGSKSLAPRRGRVGGSEVVFLNEHPLLAMHIRRDGSRGGVICTVISGRGSGSPGFLRRDPQIFLVK